MKHLDNLLNEYIRKGLVSEVFMYKIITYEHRICRINLLLNKKYKWKIPPITLFAY